MEREKPNMTQLMSNIKQIYIGSVIGYGNERGGRAKLFKGNNNPANFALGIDYID